MTARRWLAVAVADAMLALAAVIILLASIRLLGDDFDFREDPNVETAYLIAAVVIALVPLVAALISGHQRPLVAGGLGTVVLIVTFSTPLLVYPWLDFAGLSLGLYFSALVVLPRVVGSGNVLRALVTIAFAVFVLVMSAILTWAIAFLAYPIVAIADQVADRAHAQR